MLKKPKFSLNSTLNSPLVPGREITIRQAVLNCAKLGRVHRRNLCRRLCMEWSEYLRLEAHALKAI